MNSAKLENSVRLNRVLSVLKKASRPVSTMEIINRARVCAVSAIVSELRDNGIGISCQRTGDIWRYQLEAQK